MDQCNKGRTTQIILQLQGVNAANRRDNLVNASLGVKFNVRGGTVLVINGIAPLRKIGLELDFIWSVELEGAF